MRTFGLLGERLAHSFSPLLHAELGDYEYQLYEKNPDELDDFLKHGIFDGLNVTVPYKKTVIPYCAGLSGSALAIGSVNTITRLPDGSLYGDNTDYFGFLYLIKKTGINPAEGKTIVLGSGGSSLTVRAVLRDLNAKEVVVVSRSGGDNYQNISKHHDAMIIVNTTPVGMYPNNGSSPLLDLKPFSQCRAVIDLVYNPAKTELLLIAEEQGIFGINGLFMLTAQAKAAAELFMTAPIPDEKIETLTAKLARQTQNIVLIGMPGCGKTSTGAALAKKLKREFADTDDLVIEAAGKPIPDIFKNDGEAFFRALENDALQALCKRTGLVISTGGGVIKREENRRVIRQNGIIVFLDRDIAELTISGRPLSERDGVETLAKERLPIYKRWSECTVSVCGVEQTAEGIYEKIFNHQRS